VEFRDELPAFNEALHPRVGERLIVFEVVCQLDPLAVRAIAMAHREGPSRGMPVERSGRPILVLAHPVLFRVESTVAFNPNSSDPSSAMQPSVNVNPTSEHALYLRLFVTNAGGW
jgi:F0F1-type ATP synthase beta subunit